MASLQHAKAMHVMMLFAGQQLPLRLFLDAVGDVQVIIVDDIVTKEVSSSCTVGRRGWAENSMLLSMCDSFLSHSATCTQAHARVGLYCAQSGAVFASNLRS